MSWLRNVLGLRQAKERAEATPSPEHKDWKALGNAALAAGDLAEAARCYANGVRETPADAPLAVNLGFALLEQGRASAAVDPLQRALALQQPGDTFAHEAHYLLARAYGQLGQADQALAQLAEAVRVQPTFTPAMDEAVTLLLQANRPGDAVGWARRRARLEPTPAALLQLAHCCYVGGAHEQAREALDAVLQAEPANAAALEGRASLSLAQGRPEEALADFDAALRGGAGAHLQFGRAMALRKCGRTTESLDAIERVLAAEPRHRDALLEQGRLLAELLRLAQADTALTRAIDIHPGDPDLIWARATTRLQAGDMVGGWTDYEVRHEAPSAGLKFAPQDYGVPHWTGAESLQGRSMLVLAEQGLGDSIQFARYLPLLEQRGARVTFHAPAALHPLIADAMPGVRLVQGGDIEKPDYQCLLLSLPRAFGTTMATVPAQVPYLRSRPELRAAWEARLGARQRLRVGLVWSGGTLLLNDAKRSIALEKLRALDLPGVQFVSLQKEVRESDRHALQAWPALSHHGEALHSFADTAALVDLMDVVISVDTSVAHLAGALGRPLWVLLPHHPDWRWLVGREDSPWYPSARLYRQPVPGDWPAVIARVRGDLMGLRAAA